MNDTAELFDFPTAARHVRAVPPLAVQHDREVLAELLRGACDDPEGVAKRLLVRFGCLGRLFWASSFDLETVAGVTRAAAIVICACQEMNERRLRESASKRPVISSWTALLAYARVAMAGRPREQFRVIFLDSKLAIISDEVMSEGSATHAPVYPREVVRRALELNASAIILAHNHPSGDPTPSGADVEMTRQIVEAARVFKIEVHDHLVVGENGIASFKALGLFPS